MHRFTLYKVVKVVNSITGGRSHSCQRSFWQRFHLNQIIFAPYYYLYVSSFVSRITASSLSQWVTSLDFLRRVPRVGAEAEVESVNYLQLKLILK